MGWLRLGETDSVCLLCEHFLTPLPQNSGFEGSISGCDFTSNWGLFYPKV